MSADSSVASRKAVSASSVSDSPKCVRKSARSPPSMSSTKPPICLTARVFSSATLPSAASMSDS